MQADVTPAQIAAAWAAWDARWGGRHNEHRPKLGPGPAFVEAIRAAMAAQPVKEMRHAD